MYIGQTTRTLKIRVRDHLYGKEKFYFQNVLRKYGKDKFIWEVLCECKDIDELNKMEQFCITFFNTMVPNGYNLTTGGDNCIVSEETKKKLSEASKGKEKTKDHNLKNSIAIKKLYDNGWKNPNKGKPMGGEQKKKISISNKGKKRTPENILNMSMAQKKLYDNGYINPRKGKKGKPMSEEHKRKISETIKNKKLLKNKIETNA